ARAVGGPGRHARTRVGRHIGRWDRGGGAPAGRAAGAARRRPPGRGPAGADRTRRQHRGGPRLRRWGTVGRTARRPPIYPAGGGGRVHAYARGGSATATPGRAAGATTAA